MRGCKHIWMQGVLLFLLNFFLVLHVAFADDCSRDPLNAND